MAYEDLTTYTKSGAQSYKFSITSLRCTFSSINGWDTAYAYKSFGAGHFGDYEIDFDFRLNNRDGDQGMPEEVLLSVTNTPNRLDSITSGQLVSLRHHGTWYTQYGLFLRDRGNSNYVLIDSTSFVEDTTYYFKITRSGTTFTFKAYTSSADRGSDTNVYKTNSITCQDTTLQYVMCGATWGAGFSTTVSGYTENIDLHDETPRRPIPAFIR